MKAKLIFIICYGTMALLTSCMDLFDQRIEVTFETDMDIEITQKNDGLFYFTGSAILNIEDHPEVKKQLKRLKNLEVFRVECTLTGIPGQEYVSEMKFRIVDMNKEFELWNLTDYETVNVPIEDIDLEFFAGYLYSHRWVTIEVEGLSTYAPMTLGVRIRYPSQIRVGV